jgi:hypothetical protein
MKLVNTLAWIFGIAAGFYFGLFVGFICAEHWGMGIRFATAIHTFLMGVPDGFRI